MFDSRTLSRILFFAAAVTVPACFAAVQTVGSFRIGMDLGGQRVPVWNQSGLVVLTGGGTQHPSFTVSDESGAVVSTIAITIPGASIVAVHDYSHASDGSIAFCGVAMDQDGRDAPFVAVVSPATQNLTVTRTGTYYPHKITVSTDGHVWTVGYAYLPNGNKKLDSAAPMLRTWTSDLKTMSGLVPQSSLQAPKSAAVDANKLRAGGNRVGWFAPSEGKYFEVDSSGSLMAIRNVTLLPSQRVTGMAITDSGRVFLSLSSGDGQWAVAELNRATPSWTTILGSSQPSSPLLIWGAVGEQLVGKWGRSDPEGKVFEVR